jgi:hypothetical protein
MPTDEQRIEARDRRAGDVGGFHRPPADPSAEVLADGSSAASWRRCASLACGGPAEGRQDREGQLGTAVAAKYALGIRDPYGRQGQRPLV